MMLLLGRIYRELGVYDRAQPLLERRWRTVRRSVGDDERAVGRGDGGARPALAGQGPAGRGRAAAPRDAGDAARALAHPDHAEVGKTLRDLALVLASRGKHDEAETLQREALALHEARFGTDHAEIASDLEGLQAILVPAGRSTGRSPTRGARSTMRQKLLGPDHLETATAMNNLAHPAATRNGSCRKRSGSIDRCSSSICGGWARCTRTPRR